MIGTYAAALLVIGAALPVGGAILLACGRREWSWAAPAVGLAAIAILAWWTVRLPGEGLAALLAIAAAALVGAVWVGRRMSGLGAAAGEGAPVAILTLLAASIPFIAEGQFGILGTGFNVDMSQHLFAADWIAEPIGRTPDLIEQGYPVGPHALAAAGASLGGGELATAFSGVTVAVPVLLALSALVVLRELPRGRAALAALLVGVPYLVASYLAQGSFTELFQVAFLVGFALALREMAAGRGGEGWRAGMPLGVLGAGALYAYSAPGVAWLIGVAGLWALLELRRAPVPGTAGLGRPPAIGAAVRAALPATLAAIVALLVLAAPEASRVIEFGTNVESVARAAVAEPAAEAADDPERPATVDEPEPVAADLEPERRTAAAEVEPAAPAAADDPLRFDDRLGNLFGQISPLTALGVWPSGDFRVQPGDGAVPGALFYLGALIALAALGVGIAGALRRGETALLAALVAAVGIWLLARGLSTPYVTAKALQMFAPLAALLATRELLDPSFLGRSGAVRAGLDPSFTGGSGAARPRLDRPSLPGSGAARPRLDRSFLHGLGAARPSLLRSGLTLAFLGAAALSSGLALANAPVGPDRYSPGIAKLRSDLVGEPVLLLAPPRELAERHGAAYYGWELRGTTPGCVEPRPGARRFDRPAPPGIRYVLTLGRGQPAPFEGVVEVDGRRGATLWENQDFDRPAAREITFDPEQPTSCNLDP